MNNLDQINKIQRLVLKSIIGQEQLVQRLIIALLAGLAKSRPLKASPASSNPDSRLTGELQGLQKAVLDSEKRWT
jgi:hypothetical protein